MDTPWDWSLLLWHVTLVLIYTLIGLVFFALAYFVVDKATPFSLHKELIEHKNTALAIVLGSIFIAIAIIVSSSIRG